MTTQQEFLRAAMVELDMTRDRFCERLGCARRTLDKWLLPQASNDFRNMDEAMWKFVREILAHEKLKSAHEKVAKKNAKISAYIPNGDI